MSNLRIFSLFRTLRNRFQNHSHRRGWRGYQGSIDPLEERRLLTVDLTIGVFKVAPSLDAFRGPGNAVFVSTSVLVQQKNLGTTSADLQNGTPNDDSDNVKIQFFSSSDSTLDGGDQLVGEFNSGVFNSAIAANTAILATLAGVADVPVGPNSNFLIAKIDATNVLTETNESNNVVALDIRRPSLNVTGAGETVSRKNKLFSVDPAVGFLDGDSPNYKDGRVVVSIVSPQSGDSLQVIRSGKGEERLKVSGTSLKRGKELIGTVTGNKSTSITIDFNSNVDPVTVQQVLRGIGFKTRSDASSDREISFQMKDPAGQTSDLVSKNVFISFA